jgi:Tol biopolymer transport system component
MIELRGGGKTVRLLNGPFNELNAGLSPDGRWMAYQSDESGRHEIYVRPFPDVDADRTYDVAPDGRRVIAVKEDEENAAPPQIIVVQGWFEELRRLEPAD